MDYHYILVGKGDIRIMATIWVLVCLAFLVHIIRRINKNGKPIDKSPSLEPAETVSYGIAVEIRRAQSEDELIRTLKSIKKFEIHFPQAVDEMKELKELYEWKARDIYADIVTIEY